MTINLDPYRLPNLSTSAASDTAREVLAYWAMRVSSVYPPDAADWVIGQDSIYLCDETEAYLYNDHTPLTLAYKPGSRPVLEAILRGTINIDQYTTERDKAMAIMRYTRDIWLEREGAEVMNAPYHNGTEEQVIEKLSKLCNELARVMIVLAQMAGLPARYVGHIPGDHGVVEIHVDGIWAYFDVRGHQFEQPDGRLTSFAELRRHPEWIDQQADRVEPELSPGYTLKTTREFVRPECMTFIANYFVWEANRYSFDKIPNTPELMATVEATNPDWKTIKEKHYAYSQPIL